MKAPHAGTADTGCLVRTDYGRYHRRVVVKLPMPAQEPGLPQGAAIGVKVKKASAPEISTQGKAADRKQVYGVS